MRPIGCLRRRWCGVFVWLAGAGLLGAAGCESAGWNLAQDTGGDPEAASEMAPAPALSTHEGSDPEAGPDPSSRRVRPVVVLHITFDILRARVAAGVFSESGRIWNHLDEKAIPADLALMLQRNGLRVARGKEDSWPPIKALLEEQERVETSSDRVSISNGLPLMVELDSRPRDQVFFMFRADGTLGGASFPDSTNVLRIEYDISLARASALQVKVMPEIRLPRRPPRLRPGEPNPFGVPWEQPARVLRELAFEMEIGPDEFFVIGPGPTTEQEHLAGSLLLREEIDGRPLESMYFITPRVFRTGPSTGS